MGITPGTPIRRARRSGNPVPQAAAFPPITPGRTP